MSHWTKFAQDVDRFLLMTSLTQTSGSIISKSYECISELQFLLVVVPTMAVIQVAPDGLVVKIIDVMILNSQKIS